MSTSICLTPLQLADNLAACASHHEARWHNEPDDKDWNRGRYEAFRDAATMVRELGQLKWTSELPTEPGYYWHHLAGSSATPTIREVWQTNQGLFLVQPGLPWLNLGALGEENEWAGLLNPPTETSENPVLSERALRDITTDKIE